MEMNERSNELIDSNPFESPEIRRNNPNYQGGGGANLEDGGRRRGNKGRQRNNPMLNTDTGNSEVRNTNWPKASSHPKDLIDAFLCINWITITNSISCPPLSLSFLSPNFSCCAFADARNISILRAQQPINPLPFPSWFETEPRVSLPLFLPLNVFVSVHVNV